MHIHFILLIFPDSVRPTVPYPVGFFHITEKHKYGAVHISSYLAAHMEEGSSHLYRYKLMDANYTHAVLSLTLALSSNSVTLNYCVLLLVL